MATPGSTTPNTTWATRRPPQPRRTKPRMRNRLPHPRRRALGRDEALPGKPRRAQVRSYDHPGSSFPMTIEQHQAKAEQLLRIADTLPVDTVDSVEPARRLADALLAGSLRSIELTLRTPVALEALAALDRKSTRLNSRH